MLKTHGFKHVVEEPAPPIPPKDSETYPVLAALGYENWPEVEVFEDLPVPVKFAWAAAKGTTDLAEQQLDFIVIGNETPPSQNQYGNWHGPAATNHNFISYYYQGAGQSYGALVDVSWQAYLNWILGIDDGASHRVWDGTEAGIQSYKYWAAQTKKLSFSAVPHNGW